MAIPTYDRFIEPLLTYLAGQSEPVRTRRAYEAMAERLGIPQEEKAQLLPSGAQAVYQNRICWAHDRLKRMGYSESPRRGYWLLTEAGRAFAESNPHLSDEQVHKIAKASARASATADDAAPGPLEADAIETLSAQSPLERIESGLEEVRASVAQDLLEVIGRGSSDFFEQLVLDVLHAMGYGTSRHDVQRVGRSGDGGIDGIISLDRLGLEKVYVQAKKWNGQVGSPQIQGFMGALQLQGASKGVLITSGSISGPAWEAAKLARGSVVLIDGQRLAALMIEHGVGVSHKLVRIPKVDMDYFEDE